MKRFFILIALAVIACTKVSLNENAVLPVIEFGERLYTLYPEGSVDIYLGCSKAPSKDLTIGLVFSGDAVRGVDFECPESVTIQAGSTSCYFSFKDKNLARGKEVGIALKPPKGWKEGVNSKAVIALADVEQLVYSFSYPEGVLHEGLPITVSLAGEQSGTAFVADADIHFPLACYSRILDKLDIPEMVIPKGRNSSTVIIRLNDPEWHGNEVLVITADPDNHRFVADEAKRDMKVFVRGMQTPDQLVGLWRFRTVYDIEEIEEWFSEMDDNPALLPTHNDGFYLEFWKDGDKVMLKTSGPGDFNWFFRECEVTLTSPMNMTSGGYALGNYTSFESNQFIADNLETYQTNTYYKLSVANRAFSAINEDLGPATIVFRLTINGDLCMEFRDYDNTSLFGENWWDPGKFDPDMFGFASRFTKVEAVL